MLEKNASCCHKCCHPFAKEFKREKFSLAHEPIDDFFKSQWQRHTKSVLWLIYRWCLALCFFLGVVGSCVQHFNEGKWFIYLTDWGFVLCMYTSIFGAVLVSIYYCNPHKFVFNSLVLKIYWASHWTTLTLAAMITFIYWIFIFPVDPSSPTALYNLWAHAFNSILMILDHLLVAFPTRILHFVFPFTVGMIYGLFSLVYYLAGGVNELGDRFIYQILDWSEPGWAILTVFGCIVLVFIFSILLFVVYKMRSLIHRTSYKTDSAISE